MIRVKFMCRRPVFDSILGRVFVSNVSSWCIIRVSIRPSMCVLPAIPNSMLIMWKCVYLILATMTYLIFSLLPALVFGRPLSWTPRYYTSAVPNVLGICVHGNTLHLLRMSILSDFVNIFLNKSLFFRSTHILIQYYGVLSALHRRTDRYPSFRRDILNHVLR